MSSTLCDKDICSCGNAFEVTLILSPAGKTVMPTKSKETRGNNETFSSNRN